MQEIMELLNQYGVSTVVLAVLINISTSFLKIPIKAVSKKNPELKRELNRYITLLPVLLGVLYATIYTLIVYRVAWNGNTLSLALTSASLSLALYAILEKFFDKEAASAVPAEEGGEQPPSGADEAGPGTEQQADPDGEEPSALQSGDTATPAGAETGKEEETGA